MINHSCDICGKTTYINPLSENIPVKDDNGNIIGYEQTEMFVQNTSTGEMETVKIPKLNDLQERCYKVILFCGFENITKDFCKDCLEKNEIGNKIKDLFNSLKNISSK